MSPGAATERLYLVDAHSLIFQVFHAIRGMSTPSGLPSNALFGFTRDLLYLRSLKPAYLLCAFDLSAPTFREKVYPQYKPNPPPPPSDPSVHVPLIERMPAPMH